MGRLEGGNLGHTNLVSLPANDTFWLCDRFLGVSLPTDVFYLYGNEEQNDFHSLNLEPIASLVQIKLEAIIAIIPI